MASPAKKPRTAEPENDVPENTLVSENKIVPENDLVRMFEHMHTLGLPFYVQAYSRNYSFLAVPLEIKETRRTGNEGDAMVWFKGVHARLMPDYNEKFQSNLVYEMAFFSPKYSLNRESVTMRLRGGGPYSPTITEVYVTRKVWLANAARVDAKDAEAGRPAENWEALVRETLPDHPFVI